MTLFLIYECCPKYWYIDILLYWKVKNGTLWLVQSIDAGSELRSAQPTCTQTVQVLRLLRLCEADDITRGPVDFSALSTSTSLTHHFTSHTLVDEHPLATGRKINAFPCIVLKSSKPVLWLKTEICKQTIINPPQKRLLAVGCHESSGCHSLTNQWSAAV